MPGAQWVKGIDKEQHENEVCAHRHIQCPAGCSIFVRANPAAIAKHNAEKCEKRLVPCPNGCTDPVRFEAMDDHLAFCEYALFPCGAGRYVAHVVVLRCMLSMGRCPGG